MVVFEKHRPVSPGAARKAVTKAGFEYRGAEVAAHGHLAWSDTPGASALLLEDPEADMRLLLTASDTGTARSDLGGAFREGGLGDTVQVKGPVDESDPARRKARKARTAFTLIVAEWSPGKTARPPLLVPEKARTKTPPEPEDPGWF